MRYTIIVASSDAAQLELLMEAAEAIRGMSKVPYRIFSAMSVEDIKRLRGSPRDTTTELLVVTAALLQGHSNAVLKAQPGYDLVKTLQDTSSPTACILVSDRVEHYREVQKMPRCEWLLVDAGTNYVDLCVTLAAKLGILPAQSGSVLRNGASTLASAHPDPGPNGRKATRGSTGASPLCDGTTSSPSSSKTAPSNSPYALLEVELRNRAEHATVKLHGRDLMQSRFEAPAAPLNLRQSDVDGIIKDSRRLKEQFSRARRADANERQRFQRGWQADYRSLGERIHKLLWSDTFAEYYHFGAGKAGGASNVRLRFNLEPCVFDGLWEAMYNPNKARFLMLESTLARRAVQYRVDPFPPDDSDDGDGVLSVLFIGSDVPDGSTPEGPDDSAWKSFWDGLNGDLPSLPHLNDEMNVLRKLRRDSERACKNHSGPRGRKIQVDFVRGDLRPGRSSSLAEEIEQKLKKDPRRYDVVHFAGHALFPSKYDRDRDNRGYLIFSGSPPRAVPIGVVADWLRGTSVQLVCLSCCRSSAVQAAKEFADNNVPMTIGFSWDLDDSKAVDFTRFFYQELLAEAGLKVCPAFRNARSKLHKQYEGGDPIWASPVLIAQPMNWIKVEGALCPPTRKLAARRRRAVQMTRGAAGPGVTESWKPLGGEAAPGIVQSSTA